LYKKVFSRMYNLAVSIRDYDLHAGLLMYAEMLQFWTMAKYKHPLSIFVDVIKLFNSSLTVRTTKPKCMSALAYLSETLLRAGYRSFIRRKAKYIREARDNRSSLFVLCRMSYNILRPQFLNVRNELKCVSLANLLGLV